MGRGTQKAGFAGRLLCLLLCLAAALSLSGCSLTGFDIQGLMSPPKANEDQQQIYELMKDESGDVDFYYPKDGEYRSAVIMRDLTGNGQEEALGFSGGPDGGITARFFRKTGGSWSQVSSYKNSASQVDRVLFGDLTGNGQEDVVVGWGSPQSKTATLAVYSFQDNGDWVAEYADGYSYSEMMLTDFDADGVMEIFTADVSPQAGAAEQTDIGAYAKVYEMRKSRPIPVYSTKLSSNVEKYSAISCSRAWGGGFMVVLDGLEADGSTITQLVAMNENGSAIYAPLSSEEAREKYGFFLRPPQVQIACMDIGEDGYLEIPWVSLTAGHSSNVTHPSSAYLVDWVRFNLRTGDTVSILPTILNLEENYYLELPGGLKHHIVCYEEGSSRELTFYRVEYDGFGQISTSLKLFSVRAFTRSGWKEQNTGEYELLSEGQGDIVYGAKRYRSGVTTDTMLASFQIIEE